MCKADYFVVSLIYKPKRKPRYSAVGLQRVTLTGPDQFSQYLGLGKDQTKFQFFLPGGELVATPTRCNCIPLIFS